MPRVSRIVALTHLVLIACSSARGSPSSSIPSRFLKLRPCGKNGYSPLHLAVDRNTTCVGRYPVCKFPSLTVASILLECGADVNCRDEDDNR